MKVFNIEHPAARDWDGDDFHYLYALKCGPYIKVGITEYIDARMKQYTTHNPFKMKRILLRTLRRRHARAAEKHIHLALTEVHHRGEWFMASVLDVKTAVRRAMAFVDRREGEFILRRASPDFDEWNGEYETAA